MVALQQGSDGTDGKGKPVRRQAFTGGYFPVSRLVSTFPSASDVAWTEIFGGRASPGYQRTHYSISANREIFVNAVTSSAEYEKEMTWRLESRFHFAMSYVRSLKEFRYEVDRMVEEFLNHSPKGDNYYALILSTDSAQHMGADILAMLCTLDEKLQMLRAAYRVREGRELEILLLSDHGNNHAGRGHRVQINAFLKKAGYRISQSISLPRDVVLPTVGMESWVEVHNAPAETERLVELLSHLRGADLVTGRLAGCPTRILVMNSQGQRATIEWNPTSDAFRYASITGDPLEYVPALEELRRKGQLDANGFASSDDWMNETLTRRYPVALERIVQAHTHGTLNPATILISLANDHVHAGWFVATGSRLMKFGGTHGALDDLNSTGFIISSFAPTRDTTAGRVASLYDGFPGLRDPCAQAEGAEWISGVGQATITLARGPLDWARYRLPSDGIFLHIWSPRFNPTNLDVPIQVAIKIPHAPSPPKVRPGDPEPGDSLEQRFSLSAPLAIPDSTSYERVYALPPSMVLATQKEYRITGWIENGGKTVRLFSFAFFSDARAKPAAY
jgi:hypothetical protein